MKVRLRNASLNHAPEYRDVGGFSVAHITHAGIVDQIDVDRVDAILIEDEKSLREILCHDTLFLKPLFMNGSTHRTCDGIVSLSDTHSIVHKIKVLKEAISDFEDRALPESHEERLVTKLLRYIISRNIPLQAQNSRLSRIGYQYCLVEDMSMETDPLTILNQLDQYAKKGYLKKKIVDKVNLCFTCNSSYLNFSECCSKCGSIQLESEELVHHFRCAYVGPQSDFEKDDRLICPKCDHQLKHIGIDYDKPSEIHICGSCNHQSQETQMKAKCVDCARENELDRLITRNINSYEATDKGRNFATMSKSLNFTVEAEPQAEDSLINFAAFELLRTHEIKRSTSSPTSLYQLVLTFDEALFVRLNKDKQIAILRELATIAQSYLGKNDLTSIDRYQNIHLLLIDSNEGDYLKIKEALSYNLNKMLVDNGWSENDPLVISGKKLGR